MKAILAILALCTNIVWATSGSATLDLQRYWIQDRFIRAISLSQNDQEKLQALDALIALAEQYKTAQTLTRPASVNSKYELDRKRDTYLHPRGSTHNEVAQFLRRQLPPALVLAGANVDVDSEISNINQSYRRLLDHEFSFPPKGMLTGFLKMVGFVKERQVRFFDLLFENSNDSSLAIRGLTGLSPAEKLKYLSLLQNQVSSVANTIRSSGDSVLAQSGILVKDPKVKRFVEIVLSEYFKQLPPAMLWDIIFLQMERPEITSMMDRFQLFSRNVGPHFHKLFQMIASDPDVPEALAKVFKSFQESLPPASYEAAEKMLKVSTFKEFDILELDMNPIKVGSMAQIHKAKVRFHHNGQVKDMAIRLIKPGIEKTLENDERFLDYAIEVIRRDPILGPGTEGVDYGDKIAELKDLVREELNGKMTFEHQELATHMLKSDHALVLSSGVKLTISVPDAYLSTNPSVMASDWVHGESLEDYYNRNNENGRLVAEAIFKNWLEKAVLSTGFIHADLQMGNVKIDSNVAGNTASAHILDYGMAGVIGPEGRELFILLASGIGIKNPRLVARAIWAQSLKKPDMTLAELESFIQNIFDQHEASGDKSILEKVIFQAMKKGFVFEKNFVKLARGYATVKGLLQATGSKQNVSTTVIDILRQHPELLAKSLTSLKRLSWEDAGAATRDAVVSLGKGLKNAVIDDPAGTIEKGKALLNLGKGLFGKMIQNGKPSIMTTVETGREMLGTVASKSGSWFDDIQKSVLGKKDSDHSGHVSCRKFYER